MPLETFAYIDSLNASNPPGSDGLVQGDDHIRGIKATLKNTFTGIAGATNVTETTLNALQANTHEFFVPVGAIMDFLSVPAGWLELAPGATGNRTTHARLFALIGTTYGAGDGSTTFGLPPGNRYRRGRDGTYALGAQPAGQVGTHGHTATGSTTLSIASDGSHAHTGATGGRSAAHTHTFTTGGVSTLHSHGGATGSADRSLDHSHSIGSGGSSIAGWVGGGSFTGSNVATTSGTNTGGVNSSIDHLHSISSDGQHTHTGTTDGEPQEHTHPISADGAHSHTGSTAATTVTVANSTTQENMPNTFVAITCVKY